MTKINGPRYSDSKDFNELHDKIMLDVLNNTANYVSAVSYLGQEFYFKPKYFGPAYTKGRDTSEEELNSLHMDQWRRYDKEVLDLFLKAFDTWEVKAEAPFMGSYPDITLKSGTVKYVDEYGLDSEKSYFCFIEIKSFIKSFGETLRQLQIYHHNGLLSRADGTYFGTFLLTPDRRFEKEFTSQGFPLIEDIYTTYEKDEENAVSLDSFRMGLESGREGI
jgi:hypothetical protein